MSTKKTWSLDDEAAAEGVGPRGDADPLLVPRPISLSEGAPPLRPSPVPQPRTLPLTLKERLAAPPRPLFLAEPVTLLPEFAEGELVDGRYCIYFRSPPPMVRYGSACWLVDEQTQTLLLRQLELVPGDPPDQMPPERQAEILTRLRKIEPWQRELPASGIVAVTAVGIDERRGPWVIEASPEGDPLSEVVITRGPLAEAELKSMLSQLCTIVSAAHERGIVHGGLRPEAVHLVPRVMPPPPPNYTLITPPAPIVKVSDWVLGALLAESRVGALARDAMAWFSPEQAQGRATTQVSDLHAIGLIAFYALTGRHYLTVASAPSASFMEHLKELLIEPLVPASQRAKELGCEVAVPEWFDDWFAGCIARDPGGRFASVDEARKELGSATGPQPVYKIDRPVLMGNPKGSRYAELVDPPTPPGGGEPESGPEEQWTGDYRTGPVDIRREGPVLMGNPKGSRYSDDRAGRSPRRVGLIVGLVLVVIAAAFAWLRS